MRDSLTVLAILVIGVLTAALIVPYAVDWDSHRALIERKLSDTIGTPVVVTGPIDLKLLPKPLFRFGGLAVGDGAGGRPRLSARSLDAELSLAALMRGQVQVVDTVLDRPRLDLVQGPDGGLGLVLPSGAAADRVAFDHLGIRDGTVDLTLADGRHETLAGVDLDGEAASLRGPFKAAGRVGAVPFRLATGTLDGGRLRIKLHLDGAGDGADARPSLDLDGTASDRGGGLGPGFDGSATATGQVALDGTRAAVPWRATAKLSADRDGAKAAEVELRAGADLRALIASGDGTAAFPAGPAPPRAALRLHGAVLDVDDLAASPPNSDVAPPAGLDVVRLLLRGVKDGAGLVSLPMRLDLGISFDTATLAGRTVLETAATLGLGPEPSAALTLAVGGPEGARFTLDGRVEPGPPPPVAGPFGAVPAASSAVFRGRADVRSTDLRRTARWLRPAAPALADWLVATLPGRDVAAGGTVDASATGIAARDVDLRIDGSAFRGALSFTRAVGAERARLFADLTSDALDLDRLPDLSGAAAASRDLDVDLALSARAVTLAAPASGAVAAGHVDLHLTKAGDDARLDRLALDVGGARLDAAASRDGSGGRGEVRVSAPQFGPLVDALAPVLPAPAAAALRARAASLSPVDVTLRAEASAAADGGLAPTVLALAGTAGGARIDAALSPKGPAAGRDAAARPVTLSLRADAPDGADLLRLMGVAAPGPVAGAARATATAEGTAADGFTGRLDVALGPTVLSYAGRAGMAGGAGRLTLRSTDAAAAASAFGLPAAGAPLPVDAAGDLAWDGGVASWRGVRARLGTSQVAGDLSLDLAAPRRSAAGEPAPALRGRLAVDRLPADALLALALGPAPTRPPGEAWSAQPFAAAPAALPRSDIALTVGDLPLHGGLDGRDVSLTLRTDPNSVALADAAGAAAGGSFGGGLTLRRDGPAAALSGHLSWQGVALDADGLTGRAAGSEEVAGTGDSPAALVASLAGTGMLTLSGAVLARTDPAAPARVLDAVTARDVASERGSSAADPTPPDAEALRRAVAASLDRGPLPVGDAPVPAILTGGVLRAGPLRSTGTGLIVPAGPGQGGPAAGETAGWSAEAGLALDLGTMTLATRADLRPAPGGTAAGEGGVTVTRTGPLGGEARREVDVSGLVGALQARAIARAQDRIDVMEQDIRERAAFNRQLKVIGQRQQFERDRAEAERKAEVARAAAEAQARAAAARAAADAQRQAAEARRAEDARVQTQIENAARASEVEKRRFFDDAVRDADPAPARPPSSAGRPPRAAEHGSSDPPPHPGIVQEPAAPP